MTATLTPVGSPIDMTVYEEHWEDKPTCEKCSNAAVVRIGNKCCKKSRSCCDAHYADWRQRVLAKLGVRVYCNYGCGFETPSYGFDFHTEVPL